MRTFLIILSLLVLFPTAASAKYFEPFEAENNIALAPGDILIDTAKHRLYFGYDTEMLIVYPVAVGRESESWRGTAYIGRVAEDPVWYPTVSQRARRKLPRMVPAGPANPLGAFALYLYRDGRDTLFRIHGTNVPSSIGKSVTDGCIRMRNEHIEDLYSMIDAGARVTVR